MQFNPIDDIQVERRVIGKDGEPILIVDGVLADPDRVIDDACTQTFARINPFYPGIRAELDAGALRGLCGHFNTLFSSTFKTDASSWGGQAWYSIVTTPPDKLMPIQRMPHVDGLEADQIAFLLYLHHTPHGGTSFYRHRSTGFERLTEDRFPQYKQTLEADMTRTGVPKAAYMSEDTAHFERVLSVDGIFNRMVVYRGALLHSGDIRNDTDLSEDPRTGRLTLNGFLRPA